MNKFIPKSFPGAKSAGFTLIELLVVVLIIGILASVALPQYKIAVAKSRLVSLFPLVDSIVRNQELYYVENGQYADSFDKLAITLPSGTTQTDTLISYPNGSSVSLSENGSIVRGNVGYGNLSYFVSLQYGIRGKLRRCYADYNYERVCTSLGGKGGKRPDASWGIYQLD